MARGINSPMFVHVIGILGINPYPYPASRLLVTQIPCNDHRSDPTWVDVDVQCVSQSWFLLEPYCFWTSGAFKYHRYLCSHLFRVVVQNIWSFFFVKGRNHQWNRKHLGIVPIESYARIPLKKCGWAVDVPNSWGQMQFVDGQIKCWYTNIPSIGWWEIYRKPYVQV